jgi:hypothetical protein
VREVTQQESHQLLPRCYGLKLAKVAVSVLSMPPTSEATERNFSTKNSIHIARQRCRLTQERPGQLTYVHSSQSETFKKW